MGLREVFEDATGAGAAIITSRFPNGVVGKDQYRAYERKSGTYDIVSVGYDYMPASSRRPVALDVSRDEALKILREYEEWRTLQWVRNAAPRTEDMLKAYDRFVAPKLATGKKTYIGNFVPVDWKSGLKPDERRALGISGQARAASSSSAAFTRLQELDRHAGKL